MARAVESWLLSNGLSEKKHCEAQQSWLCFFMQIFFGSYFSLAALNGLFRSSQAL